MTAAFWDDNKELSKTLPMPDAVLPESSLAPTLPMSASQQDPAPDLAPALSGEVFYLLSSISNVISGTRSIVPKRLSDRTYLISAVFLALSDDGELAVLKM